MFLRKENWNMTNQLFFGVAKALITPDKEILPLLFDLGVKKFSRIHDDLYVRCMYFDNGEDKAMFVSFDLDKAPYPDEWVKELSVLTGIPMVSILYIGIHAHSVPVTGFRPFEPYHDVSKKPLEIQKIFRDYEGFIKQRLFETALKSMESKTPAKVGYGTSECFLNINRILGYGIKNEDGSITKICCETPNGNRPVNHTVYVVKIEDPKGKALGFFINYAIHGVVMFNSDTGDGTTVISGDIGGNVSRSMEESFPESVAMWSSGAAGDINPLLRTHLSYPDPVNNELRNVKIKIVDDSELLLSFIVGHHVSAVKSAINGINHLSGNYKIYAAEEYSLTPSRKEGDKPYNLNSLKSYNYEDKELRSIPKAENISF
jgi:hypothetical protein